MRMRFVNLTCVLFVVSIVVFSGHALATTLGGPGGASWQGWHCYGGYLFRGEAHHVDCQNGRQNGEYVIETREEEKEEKACACACVCVKGGEEEGERWGIDSYV